VNQSSGTGIYGQSVSGQGVYGSGVWGVYGYSATNNGVRGVSDSSVAGGVAGRNNTGYGVAGTTLTGTAFYAQSTDVGSLFGGNHTGASGNLIKLQSGGVDKFVVDKNGNVTVGGTMSGSCPSGMANAGSFCIDTTMSGAATMYNAMASCQTSGKVLCSMSEWISACKADLFSYTASTMIRIPEFWDASTSMGICYTSSSGTCSAGTLTPNNCLISSSYGYYCCSSK
jgi:hypothetical protein